MAKILKSAAMAAGAGLALSLGSIAAPSKRRLSADEIVELEPLLDRIEALERRVALTPDALFEPSNLNRIEDTVAARVAERLAPLQDTISRQAAALDDLRARVEQSDLNLQRLVELVHRLVERERAHTPAAANGSFQDHLDEALTSETTPLSARLQSWPRRHDA
jgi:uncharacterized coiled-coil protein SlyX